MSEKNLPPSEQKRRHARENGEFGLSQEWSKLLKFSLLAETVFGTEPLWREMLERNLQIAIMAIAQPGPARLEGAWSTFTTAVLLMLALAAVSALVSLLATLSQTGFNVAPKALGKGIKKLDVATNLRQLLAPKKFLMAVLGPMKIAALLLPGYVHIRAQLPGLAQLYHLSPRQGWSAAIEMLHQVERRCIGVLIVLALVDVALQRYMSYRGMRMDIQEMRRDHKESEGDPHAKGQRRGIAKQNAMEAPRAPGTMAVVVNPEHIAVALAYDIRAGGLPRIVGKGRDADADLLRKIAAERRIPIIKYPGLARQLYATGQPGAHVPSHTLRAVALLYRAVQELGAAPPGGLQEIDEELGQAMLKGPLPEGAAPEPTRARHVSQRNAARPSSMDQ
ncbi:flagellar biosynthesis protein FlhB [Duganella violaceipulchra]|uniref:EscU/YscU/HrcU family type III secretion system export apparatus switch protein n=1 Tax=Duganella violaceipulchra TaxID=2849652 RepID=A0AA41HEV1_9BURK|nr:EscU/YscU/HrcU family type III secretion system export apparatus switch protein [Duganella violaceicalia]MBV6322463.1 EscU/YscU/HrcU family type III secretion system export apparatus switch protein [Duganella violaceicalia]MCP2010668.1 flagellar biosynthesis protein FlhB [Duganella violaceicalia]